MLSPEGRGSLIRSNISLDISHWRPTVAGSWLGQIENRAIESYWRSHTVEKSGWGRKISAANDDRISSGCFKVSKVTASPALLNWFLVCRSIRWNITVLRRSSAAEWIIGLMVRDCKFKTPTKATCEGENENARQFWAACNACTLTHTSLPEHKVIGVPWPRTPNTISRAADSHQCHANETEEHKQAFVPESLRPTRCK